MKIILILLGVFLFLNGFILAFTTNFNLGTVFTILLGILTLVLGIYFDNVYKVTQKGLLKWIKHLVILGVILLVCLIIFIAGYGNTDTVTYDEDALIVLGAGIRGETVTLPLKYRLDKAVQYYKKNQDVVIVVSGGQGFQEDITEALAMERYLVSLGIPKDKIIKEENATSTYENFAYSKKILDNHFKGDYKTAYITNDFHIYRAGKLSRMASLQSTHYHAKIQWYTISVNYLRECAAVLKLWVFGN